MLRPSLDSPSRVGAIWAQEKRFIGLGPGGWSGKNAPIKISYSPQASGGEKGLS